MNAAESDENLDFASIWSKKTGKIAIVFFLLHIYIISSNAGTHLTNMLYSHLYCDQSSLKG